MSDINDAKRRILERVPLADLIGDKISPQKRSGQVVGLCPFHEERTPSFYVYHDHYHCFGCKAHGDAITYVMHAQGLGFIHALKWLAERFGIDVPELEANQADRGKWKQNANKSKILIAAQEFFRQHLATHEGKKVVSYLHARGFDDANIKEFGFGFAPDSRNALVVHLQKLGFYFNDIQECSLANGKSDYAFDFFQNRLMVPVRDFQGRLIAFGGRAMGDDPAKYKNSKYDKGLNLFGFDKVRTVAKSRGRIIVVEGYMDVLQLWQNGYVEAVACQGTALTIQQMKLLSGATNQVFLLFDGDSAGRNANLKVIEDALDTPEVDFKVALLPEGEDPDSFVKKNGKDSLEPILKNAVDLIQYVINTKFQGLHDTAIPDMMNKEFIPWVQKISDPIKKDFIVSLLSKLSGISRDTIIPQAQQKPKMIAAKNNEAQNVVVRDSTKIEALSPIAYELFAHLFFARPDEVVIDEVSGFLQKHLQQSFAWEEFGLEMLSCLQKGVSPCETEILTWNSTQPEIITNFVLNLQKKVALFAVKDRKHMLKILQLQHIKTQTKNIITTLKSDLIKVQSSAEKIDILKSIATLNKDLEQIKIQMQGIG